MGNCIHQDTENRRLIGSPSTIMLARKQSLKKKNQLRFEVVTWHNQAIPNLRNTKDTTKSSIIVNKSGKFLFSENLDKSIFVEDDGTTKKPLDNDFDKNFYPKGILELDVSRNSQGFFEIKNPQQSLYELITTEKQIFCEDIFFFAGIQYTFAKFVKDNKYLQQQVDKVATFSEGPKINTANFLRSFQDVSQNGNQNFVCRICLEGQTSKQDPLICPCDCTGSVQYMHLKCWGSWIFSSEVSDSEFYVGNILRPECEVCKKNLLKDNYYRETVAALLSSAAKIKTPFMVLEGFKPDSNSLCSRRLIPKLSYIIVSFAESKRITIGRGKVDVPSGTEQKNANGNTTLELRGNKIFIEDQVSKRGTYAKIQGPLVVQDECPRYLLYKNNLVTVKLT